MMDYVYLILSSIIILACFYFIVSPFFSTKTKGALMVENEEETLTLEEVYRAVNELEMDYLMKKIKDTDYKSLKEQYQLLAASMMKQGEKQKNKVSKTNSEADKVELEILAELQNLRKQRGR